MQVLDLQQGSPEWQTARRRSRPASKAAVMMACDPHGESRADYIEERATGVIREVSDFVQKRIFDPGHAVEELARPIIEEMIGKTLYRATVTTDDGYLLASLDGLPMDEEEIFEHKKWNDALAECVRNKDLPPGYYWQLEQQLECVPTAKRVIFVVSDGTADKMVWMEYTRVPGRAKQLLSGWKQLDEDVAAWTPRSRTEVVVAKVRKQLPAVVVTIGGTLSVKHDFEKFELALTEFIDGIPTEPKTDQEFADVEADCKSLELAEKAMKGAIDNAIAQVTDLETMKALALRLIKVASSTRLARMGKVDAQKDKIRRDAVARGNDVMATHIEGLNKKLGKPYMPPIETDFPGAIKGKRKLDTLNGAIDDEIARAKQVANDYYTLILENLGSLREKAVAHAFLFLPDIRQLVLKPNADLLAVIDQRINEYEAAEKKKRDDKAAADKVIEDARLAAIETAKAKAQADADAEEARMGEGSAVHPAGALASVGMPMHRSPSASYTYPDGPTEAIASTGTVEFVQAKPPVEPQGDPTLNIGTINSRFNGVLGLTASSLEALGFKPTPVKGAKLYFEVQFPLMCEALINHIVACGQPFDPRP